MSQTLTALKLSSEEDHTQSCNGEAIEFSAVVVEVLGSCPNCNDGNLVDLATGITNGCIT